MKKLHLVVLATFSAPSLALAQNVDGQSALPARSAETAPAAVGAEPTPAAPASAPIESTKTEAAPEASAPQTKTEAPAPSREAAEESAKPLVGYDKGFFIESADEKFKMKVNARLQLRLTGEGFDAGDGSPTDWEHNFSIPRARLSFAGHLYSKALTYKLNIAFDRGAASLRDFYVDYKIIPGVQIRAGQDMRPFSRQRITSGGRQQFVDRPLTDNEFVANRDTGVMIHNEITKVEGFEYAVALYNGNGTKPLGAVEGVDPATGEGTYDFFASNVPDKTFPQLVARIGYNNKGEDSYVESDVKGGGFRYGVGVSGKVRFDANSANQGDAAAEVDAIVKYEGFSATGAYYLRSDQVGPSWGRDRTMGATGFHLQGGYVIAHRFEPAVRYAQIRHEVAQEDISQYAAAFNIFFHGHELKLANDFTYQTTRAPGTSTEAVYLMRSQIQMDF
jgi:hypothetical protein